jgi:hypothetical protein
MSTTLYLLILDIPTYGLILMIIEFEWYTTIRGSSYLDNTCVDCASHTYSSTLHVI